MKTCRYCLNPAETDGPCLRDVAGFPGYRIGCDGNVWSCWNSRWGMSSTWRQLKAKQTKKGPPHYAYVSLTRGAGKGQRNQYVHLLVLAAFVGPCPNGMEGCHGDGNSLNNVLGNLRWDTSQANKADAKAHGTFAHGDKMPHAKLTNDLVRELRARRAAGDRPKDMARELGMHMRNVQRAISGATWKHVK